MRHLAERLFLSPRTVSAHLYRTFPKLGISRECLVAELGAAAGDVAGELARDVLRVAVVASHREHGHAVLSRPPAIGSVSINLVRTAAVTPRPVGHRHRG